MKNPLVRPLENGSDWQLEENYIYPLNNQTIFIPRGFIFDYASIPRIAWRLFPPATGRHRVPSLIHDWLCATGRVSWKEAANIFLYAMEEAKVIAWKRYSIYFAVRLFGPFHTPDKRKERLLVLQQAEVMQAEIYYPNIL